MIVSWALVSNLFIAEHFMIAEAKLVSKVVIYDASELLPVSKVLARNYRLVFFLY